MNELLKTAMTTEFFIYISILIILCTVGILRRNDFGKVDKLFYILFIIALITECIASILSLAFRNNNWIYYLYSPLETFIICRYYNQAVPILKKHNIGTLIGTLSILFAIVDVLFWDNIRKNNSIYLIYEQFIVCCLSLVSYYDLLKSDENKMLDKAQFWFTSSLLLYSVYFLLIWGLEPFVGNKWKGLAFLMISLGNVLYYLTCTFVFARYKKLIPSGNL